MLFRIASVAVLFSAQSPLLYPACTNEGLIWWIANPLVKIRPFDPIPASPVHDAEIFAARNEFEPFQMVLRPEGTEAEDLDVEFADFRTDKGSQISKDKVTVYVERFLNITHPTSSEGLTGLWPDPLIPRIDHYANEKRNAFPLSVQRGRNQPLWVEVFVPADAAPGRYIGAMRILSGKKVVITIPIHLTVWAFILPSTATLKSSFGFSGTTALKQHRGRYTNDDDLYSLTRLYQKAALQHRISIHGGSQVPPKVLDSSARMQLDWRDYDAEVGPFLQGTAISSKEALYGAVATSIDLRTQPGLTADEQRAYLRAWTKHFRDKGWSDRLFFYVWDEPKPTDYPAVLQRGQAALEADPTIRNLVTAPFAKRLQEVVRVWVPLVNCLIKKPGFDDFCSEAAPLESYERGVQQGGELWFYQSCASHGCNVPGGEYFDGWPSYAIDASGAANRIMQWIAWKYKIQGELYYSMNEAYGRVPDPWVDVRLFGGNGDGTLFYPGRPDRIGGHAGIPIESIRLKLIREGMEDYEYLALLAKLEGRAAADQYADRIVKEPYLWEAGSEPFLRVRRELGDRIDRLTALPSATGSNAQ